MPRNKVLKCSELEATGCRSKGVARKRVRYSLFSKGRKRLRIYLNQDKEQDIQSGRNRLRIYMSAKAQGVPVWKVEVADLSEP
jgi:hypothetical protein